MDHEGPQKKIIQIDEALVKRELGEVVRETVEETRFLRRQLQRLVIWPILGCAIHGDTDAWDVLLRANKDKELYENPVL